MRRTDGSVLDFKRLLEQDIRRSRRIHPAEKSNQGRLTGDPCDWMLLVALAAFMVYVGDCGIDPYYLIAE